MGDTEVADRILDSETPAEAKKLGREVKGFKQQVWDENCDRVVEEGQFLKFSQNEDMKKVSFASKIDSGICSTYVCMYLCSC